MTAPASDMQQVVVNDEDQYSLWPRDTPPPDGWRPEGFTGGRQECLDHIERVWTDMRPRSVRERSTRLRSEEGA
jgi:MbtH protein